MRKSLATCVIAAALVVPIARAEISEESGRLTLHLFGQCTPTTPCDMGATAFTQLADGGERKLPDRGLAVLNRGVRTTYVVAQLDG